ncbi:helix-turn-helix domain-containing protein [Halobacteriovorax sp. GB3]|nr:helix-turn-helix domain-containing protein [Halobacteriovorax sp. GB3]MDD0853027.1 helix-turn-helix domain-containing protein [Halobacteriovorax sp. GB3]
MEVRNYIEARMYFNSNRKTLNIERLIELIKSLKTLLKSSFFREEKNEIQDLIEDVEIRITEIRKFQQVMKQKKEEKERIRKESTYQLLPSSRVTVIRMAPTNSLLFDLEYEAISTALIKTRGNRTKATKELGISIRTLRNKLNEYKKKGLWHEYHVSRVC